MGEKGCFLIFQCYATRIGGWISLTFGSSTLADCHHIILEHCYSLRTPKLCTNLSSLYWLLSSSRKIWISPVFPVRQLITPMWVKMGEVVAGRINFIEGLLRVGA